MSFVTAGYQDAMPTIQTGGRGFVEVSRPVMVGKVAKYRLKDFESRDWVVYVSPAAKTTYNVGAFVKIDASTLLGPPGFRGTVQVARNALGAEGEGMYDEAAGTFVSAAKLTAVVNGAKASYSFSYTKVGRAPLLIFALPHHLQSLDPILRPRVTNLEMRTSTKGFATAIWTEQLTCVELNLPINMSFGPWSPGQGTDSKIRYPADTLAFISAIAERDLRRVMADKISPDSYYYAGKALARFATIVWVIKDILGNEAMASVGLTKLKRELSRYVENQQRYPLYYDDS